MKYFFAWMLGVPISFILIWLWYSKRTSKNVPTGSV